MNKTVLVNDLTNEQKEFTKLASDKAWSDVWSVTFQLNKKGELCQFNVNYKTSSVTADAIYTSLDASVLLFGNPGSKEYKEAFKHSGKTRQQINAARRLMKRGN